MVECDVHRGACTARRVASAAPSGPGYGQEDSAAACRRGILCALHEGRASVEGRGSSLQAASTHRMRPIHVRLLGLHRLVHPLELKVAVFVAWHQ